MADQPTASYLDDIMGSFSPPPTPGGSEYPQIQPNEANVATETPNDEDLQLEASNCKRVEKILDHKKRKSGIMFHVKWLGFDWSTHEPYEKIKSEKLRIFEYVKEIKKNNPRRLNPLLKNIPDLEEALRERQR